MDSARDLEYGDNEMENFYAPPQSDTIPREPLLFKEMPFKQLRKLYYRSSNISAIAGLQILGSVVVLAMLVWWGGPRLGLELNWWIALLLVFNIVSAVGIILRTVWGRVLGIIACSLMLLNFFIGTIIGIIGIIAFATSPKLFGEDRIKHGDLKREFNHRKRNKILR